MHVVLVIFPVFFLLRISAQSYATSNTTWEVRFNLIILHRDSFQPTGVTAGFTTNCPQPVALVDAFCPAEQPLYYFSIYLPFRRADDNEFFAVTQVAQVVWRANGGKPVRPGATLEFRADGDLVLSDVDSTLVWSTNTSGSGAVSINLETSGNLVLYDKHGRSVWESFQHPTDVLLPGQPLAAGSKLVSSISNENKSSGYFWLEVDKYAVALYAQTPGVPQLYGIFNSSVEIAFIRLNNCSLGVYDVQGDVIMSTPAPETGLVSDFDDFQVLKIHPDGDLRLAYGENENLSLTSLITSSTGKLPGRCGINSAILKNGSCECLSSTMETAHAPLSQVDELWSELARTKHVETPSLVCEQSESPPACDSMYTPADYPLVEAERLYEYGPLNLMKPFEGLTADECKRSCVANCSCAVVFFKSPSENYSSTTFEKSSICYQVSQIYTVEESSRGFKTFFKVRANKTVPAGLQKPPHYASRGNSPRRVVMGTIVAIAACTVIGVSYAVFHWYRTLHKYLRHEDHGLPSAAVELPRPFSYAELHMATRGFSRKIGSGAFGIVFEGVLSDGTTKVAVKRLMISKQGHRQFRAEVKAIGSIHHKNLVRLKGFCLEKSGYMIVYEHVANGSLDKWIFGKESLDWDTRLGIILDIARGLSYLHEECRDKVLHLDIKPQNILLDDRFGAKIADFGLSRMVEQGDLSKVMTMIRGTPGYMAPEWLQLRVTDKLDVYSFGVVVLEVVTGLQALHVCDSRSSRYLAAWAFERIRKGSAAEMVDERVKPELGDAYRRSQVEKVVRVGLWCIQADPLQRPSMSQVVKMLEGVLEVEEPPLPPLESSAVEARNTEFQLNVMMDMLRPHKPRSGSRACILSGCESP